VLSKQAEYYRALGAMIRAAKADGGAAIGYSACHSRMESFMPPDQVTARP
jgi:hypothetical protein